MCRSPRAPSRRAAAGAAGGVADALDAAAVAAAVRAGAARTPSSTSSRRFRSASTRATSSATSSSTTACAARARAILADAAAAAGAKRLVAQSIAFMYEPGPPGTVHGEDDPLMRRAAAVVRAHRERGQDARASTSRRGRHGASLRLLLRPRQRDRAATARWSRTCAGGGCPSSARGAGVWSFIHVDDAAAATVAALAPGAPPASTTSSTTSRRRSREWLPALAAGRRRPAPDARARRSSRGSRPASTASRR